jgi:hypothetical protein
MARWQAASRRWGGEFFLQAQQPACRVELVENGVCQQGFDQFLGGRADLGGLFEQGRAVDSIYLLFKILGFLFIVQPPDIFLR